MAEASHLAAKCDASPHFRSQDATPQRIRWVGATSGCGHLNVRAWSRLSARFARCSTTFGCSLRLEHHAARRFPKRVPAAPGVTTVTPMDIDVEQVSKLGRDLAQLGARVQDLRLFILRVSAIVAIVLMAIGLVLPAWSEEIDEKQVTARVLTVGFVAPGRSTSSGPRPRIGFLGLVLVVLLLCGVLVNAVIVGNGGREGSRVRGSSQHWPSSGQWSRPCSRTSGGSPMSPTSPVVWARSCCWSVYRRRGSSFATGPGRTCGSGSPGSVEPRTSRRRQARAGLARERPTVGSTAAAAAA